MIHIGIDGNEANILNRVGIGQFAYHVIKQIEQLTLNNTDIEITIYLKEKPRDDLPQPRERFNYKVFGPKKLWTQIALPLYLTSHAKPDVFFSPSHYAPRFCPCPYIVSVMDLSFIRYPELFAKKDLIQLTKWTDYSIKKATHIITISEFSKREIKEIYGISENRITVAYPGFDSENRKQKTDNKSKKERYLLFVGTIQPRKNIVRLIEAFEILTKDDPDLKLILVGKKGWLWDRIFNKIQKSNSQDRIEWKDFVSSEQLTKLYREAECFVLPSLYEGFGIPVLEAQANGCPVVISNSSSLPEVGGNAAVYIDPKSKKSISEGLRKILYNKNVRNELILKGYTNVNRFDWKKTAQIVLKELLQVAENKK